MNEPTSSYRALLAPIVAIAVGVTCAEAGGDDPQVATTTTTTSSAGASSSSQSAGGGAGAPAGCTSDDDCAREPDKPVCDASSGICVGCLPAADRCPVGQYCHPATLACAVGCTDDADCAPGGDLVCDTRTNTCVGCVMDDDCPPGSICLNDTCVPGCSDLQPCDAGLSCCGSVCKDLATDVLNCGNCNFACDGPPNTMPGCTGGACGWTCAAGFVDCNLDAADGCELNELQTGPCMCTPGDLQPCYQGSPGTENVGPCQGGNAECAADGLGWGACLGQVLPVAETCDDNVDQDCDGIVDNGADTDADGWSTCDGDCCDTPAECATDPKLVNPGAYELLSNGADDDCDPATSDAVAPPACATIQKFAGVSAIDVAKAIDLCQFTTDSAPLPVKKWGVISAEHLLASGAVPSVTALANMQSWQSAVLVNYGPNVAPTKGPTMAGIMSGKLRDAADPGYVQPNSGTDFNTSSTAPAAYLAAHGGQLPASQGCSGACVSGTGANDSVNVRLTIRVPTNAGSFSYQFKFYTAEYWGFSCSIYNDFFLALLQSGAPGIPLDTNISFDSLGNAVSVNNGFFTVCQPHDCYTCASGTAGLVGTGMDEVVPNANHGPGMTGGGTNWLTTEAPVVPGETIVLELMVFDVTGHILDSLALLDAFTWDPSPAQVNTHE